ncbi:MAG: TRAP transporter substrate-binding protein DctP [Rhodospirillaceae bacterium]|nr:TRAP transporter substrate-binding protein DctP [Rhodospirillaceae bacterium]
MTRYLGLLVAGVLTAMAGIQPVRAAAGEAMAFRISTENTPAHVQTQTLLRFAEAVEERLGSTLAVSVHHSAELFRGRDVAAAIMRDQVEMAVPGTWQLDRYAADIGVFLLPMFYGRPRAEIDLVRDGAIGERINAQIEAALGVHVLGRWIDLGYAHLYTVDRGIARHEDIAQFHLRIPGGQANARRIEAFGAEVVTIPWPDLPNALLSGQIDGLLTSHATIASARLWEAGVAFAFEDREYFPQYIPIVSDRFWRRQAPDVQAQLGEIWESLVDDARAEAALAQADARARLMAEGVTMVTPDEEDLLGWRTRLMGIQPQLVSDLGIDPDLVVRAGEILAAGR